MPHSISILYWYPHGTYIIENHELHFTIVELIFNFHFYELVRVIHDLMGLGTVGGFGRSGGVRAPRHIKSRGQSVHSCVLVHVIADGWVLIGNALPGDDEVHHTK